MMNGSRLKGLLARLALVTAGAILPQVTVDCQAAANQFASGFFQGLGFRASAAAVSSDDDGGNQDVCIIADCD
jgi:hypothetical protein